VALDTKKAQRRQRAADVQVKRVQAERRAHLTDLATTPEEQQQYAGSATQAQAAFDAAQAEVAQADINLQRTQVRSPVNGYVTNLLLRLGDYAHAGVTNISVIDADSDWIDGYFEETKMAHICIGDRAEAKLMGYRDPIVGQVQTVTRGISVSNAAPSTQGLPNVDPVYTWVRLAQRVPVRIRITHVPAGVTLVSGMTVTVTIRGADVQESSDWLRQRLASLVGPWLWGVQRGCECRVRVKRVGPAVSACRLHPRLRTYGCDATNRRLGPIASLRTAEKQRAFCPWDHREVGRRPADWGMIPSPHWSGSNGDQHWKAAIYIRARRCGRRAAACGARAAAGDAGDWIPQFGSV
jgi:hypothetical protein